ncbi:MAG: hypothetical protein Q8T08_25575, partial [Ignavibacteria bacterium]|nr:hypothetical protein [Ignavibacteria bacterium]
CPGDADDSGFVNASGVCGGRGRCVVTAYGGDGDAQQEQLAESDRQCVCRHPFAASAPGASCDACAFGLNASSYPECVPNFVCPRNCSFRGRCTGTGCVCDVGYFGRACQDAAISVEVASALGIRMPLSNGEGSDALFTGDIDRTLLTCEGDAARCLIIPRRRGKIVVPTRGEQIGDDLARRRFELETEDPSDYDEGILINKMRKRGRVGDYIRIDGVAGTPRDFGGPFTVSAWVQATGDTRGFLIAKVDTAFYADGRSPVLDRAAFDAQDRHVPHDALELPRYAHRLYFGVFVNGPKKRVDVLFTRDDGAVAIRHFRLGELADTLFDGTWRFLTLDFALNSIGEKQGVVYVDGRTQRT